jgi:hypothetical protein
MDRSQARALLERTTSFEFRSEQVVVREVRLLNAIAVLRHAAASDPRERVERDVPNAA